MGTEKQSKQLVSLLKLRCLANKGQALVEFTLTFMLALVVMWIPADFGLYVYSSHVAQNAAREGARIAAADPTTPQGPTTCTWPCASDTTVKKLVAERVSTGFLNTPTISMDRQIVVQPACNAQVIVTVTGSYNFWFYRMLRWFGANVPTSLPVIRTHSMRWEHQC
jgi:Flp pilus assembly protein TadG